MKFSEILSISGIGGLHKMEGRRENGLIVVALSGGKRQFVSSRKHMFTPLENITIYTDEDTVELKAVLNKMHEHGKVLDAKSSGDNLRAYFLEVLPNHDQEKVYTSDIKKMIKWYNELNDNNLLPIKDGEEEENQLKANAKQETPPSKKPSKKADTKAKKSKTVKTKTVNAPKSTQIKASGRGK